jgi:hypothetical protein
LTGDKSEWCVNFTTNLNRDFSKGVTVPVADATNVPRFSLKASGERADENVISATEDAAVLFVEKGSLGAPTFVDLDLLGTSPPSPVRAWGGTIVLGSQRNELVTLELTTTSGPVTNKFAVSSDGFVGFIVRTGGALTKIRFVATNDDAGAGGEIFVLDDVCGSSSVRAPSEPDPEIPSDDECIVDFIPFLGGILCFLFDMLFFWL